MPGAAARPGPAGITIAYVKPAAQPRGDGGPDRSAALVSAITALRPPEPMTTGELERQLGEGGLDVIYDDCAINPQPSAEDLADIASEALPSR